MIRVAIYEDSKHLLEAFELLVDSADDMICVGAYMNCRDIVHNLTNYPCDVVLMDIEMPEMNGIEGTKLVKEHFPDTQILIQTVFFEEDHIFNAICAGASGYILKSTSTDMYLEAIRDVHSGGSPITPGIARKVLTIFKNNIESKPAIPANKYDLTVQEKNVLQLLVSGKSYKMIAGELNISFETVKVHIRHIYAKLHVNSGTEAVALALKDKLI